MFAAWCLTAWNVPIVLPNCSRTFAYSTAISIAAQLTPTASAEARIRKTVRARRAAFSSGWARSTDVGVPVVVLGNLTVGGTGKTPLTIWLAGQLKVRGSNVGIVSRGYGRSGAHEPRDVSASSDWRQVGDEPVLLFVGRIQPLKGPDVAVRTLAALGRSDALLLVVGGASGTEGDEQVARLETLID